MPHKQKLRAEEKVKIVRRYLAGEVSISGAAAEAGIDGKTIQRWAMQYEAEGMAAFLPNRRNHTYSSALKEQAVQDYLSGKGSLAEISKKYGLRDKRQLQARKAQIKATVDSMTTCAMTMAFTLMIRGYSASAEPEIYTLP